MRMEMNSNLCWAKCGRKNLVAGNKCFIVQGREPDLKFQARISVSVFSRYPDTLSSLAISDTFLFRSEIPD